MITGAIADIINDEIENRKVIRKNCKHNFNPVTRICMKCAKHIYDDLNNL